MSYLGRSAKLSLKAQEKVSFLATAGQTSKTGLSYTPSFVEVYVNGVLLTDTTDYTATNGNSITFTVALLVNDEVTVVSLKTFTVADHYSKTEADTLLAAKATVANFTSTGIDDNATSTAITIDASEQVTFDGIGRFNNYINFGGLISTPATSASIYRPVDNTLAFGTASAERMRIDSSGNVMVGTTDTVPSNNGAGGDAGLAFTPAGAIRAARSGNNPLDINRMDSDGDIAAFRKDGTTVGSIGVTSSGASISLGGTAAANKLDDYEEGTFTPIYVNVAVPTYTVQTGRYTKIGRIVHCSITITCSALNTGDSSAFAISGLPFTAQLTNEVANSSLGRFTSILGSYTGPIHFRLTATAMLLMDGSDSNLSYSQGAASGSLTMAFTYEAA